MRVSLSRPVGRLVIACTENESRAALDCQAAARDNDKTRDAVFWLFDQIQIVHCVRKVNRDLYIRFWVRERLLSADILRRLHNGGRQTKTSNSDVIL